MPNALRKRRFTLAICDWLVLSEFHTVTMLPHERTDNTAPLRAPSEKAKEAAVVSRRPEVQWMGPAQWSAEQCG